MANSLSIRATIRVEVKILLVELHRSISCIIWRADLSGIIVEEGRQATVHLSLLRAFEGTKGASAMDAMANLILC
jgi:hypothetical protein